MIKFPEKNWLTFSELIQRWQCTELDLVCLILDRELVPSYRISDECRVYEVSSGSDENGEHVFLDAACKVMEGRKTLTVDEVIQSFNGFYYLMQPVDITGTDGSFRFASKMRECSEIGDQCFCLRDPLSVSDVIKNGVVMFPEVVAFEEIHEDTSQGDKPLLKRERDTLLTIIAAMAVQGLNLDIDHPGKAALFIEGLTAAFGAHVSKRAIENHLKHVPEALRIRKR